MSQPHSLDIARLCFLSLLVVTALFLGGCQGLETRADAQRSLAHAGGYQGTETLAVLLPGSGRYAAAAKVVRDGIVSAREADPQGIRPELRFYDSSGGSVTALVEKAAAEGATLVIGPLQKKAVNRVAETPVLPVPVLTLNQVSEEKTPPPNLFQFSLSPEDEAASVANKAWDQGHRSVMMLYQEGTWGNRISRAFRQEWSILGGALAATRTFDPTASDFSRIIGDLFERSEDSEAKADFVFLVATSRLASRIWPQIRGQVGTETPVYTTSHILRSGRFDPEGDRGLVGLNFVEIPWLVEPAAGDAVSAQGLASDLPRLYAMGVDAYRLGSRLEWLAANPQARVQGKTGTLAMDSQRRIQRSLTLARIDAGGPVKLSAMNADGSENHAWALPIHELGPSMATLESASGAASQH